MAITRNYNHEIIIRHMGKTPKSINSFDRSNGLYLIAIPVIIAAFMFAGFDAQGITLAQVLNSPSNFTLVAFSAVIGDVLAYIFVSTVLE